MPSIADHIAAIDNVTRKLIQAGGPCETTGLYFSLGHSAVVWLASLGIALGRHSALPGIARFREIGGAIGTTVSVAVPVGDRRRQCRGLKAWSAPSAARSAAKRAKATAR